jgi:acyl carrier protein
MQLAEIKSKLKDFFEQEFPDSGTTLSDNTNLLNDWFVDSFGIISTTLFLEQNFGIEISRADINATTFRSIETLSQYVSDKLKSLP